MARKAKNSAMKALSKLSENLEVQPQIIKGMKRRGLNKNVSEDLFEVNSANSQGNSTLGNRKRWKTLNEREVLECYFELDQEWNRRTILYVKELVHLTEKQIYKWGYEKRRRLNLHTPQEKPIDSKNVTLIGDLQKPINQKDLNSVVASLFPEEENEEETLSDLQKKAYDYVKNKLIERSIQYEGQSDLDKLLNDRIPIKNVAIEAKRSLKYIENEANAGNSNRACSELKMEKKSFSGSTQASDKSILLQLKRLPAIPLSVPANVSPVDYDLAQELTFANQIDPESQESVKDHNNSTNSKDTLTFGDLIEFEERLGFEDDFDFLSNSKDIEEMKDTINGPCLPILSNTPSFNIPIPTLSFGEEGRFETLNDI
mmetsp:Transcript_17290/g.19340  ORF Transcript_17290/g.19340 Transcript_17290/m.19340 type:complete len:372 (+) Transcript_17290:35-1150(+)|eukprot:CAMPEP_0205827976 /NCGR_PEP_ID=MMETSP0206-20130828/33698_1 /ASSEMBLY_ACC=CAM_ASM_000279 /TAXON_ID=36767 /ORGANISM="Euplotes focardii, Strain TN1" /LENGTH=371 /DNA_ID=CAMNT_0053129363 /DNA_START=34 /DNA_END=1149 /DNA_ORIENTATION=+